MVTCGCSLTSQEQPEAVLRRNELTIRNLQRELDFANEQLRDQERELLALKREPKDPRFRAASSVRAAETMVAWGIVSALRLHKLTSGILNTPGGGHELHAVLQPVDGNGEVVKVAGELRLGVQHPGHTRMLAELNITPLESRHLWSTGLIARGFYVQIPFESEVAADLMPGDRVIVSATLDLGDGRRFETTELLTVRGE